MESVGVSGTSISFSAGAAGAVVAVLVPKNDMMSQSKTVGTEKIAKVQF